MFVEAPYLLSGTSTPELLRAFVMLMVPRGSKKVHSEFLPNLKSTSGRPMPPEYAGTCSSTVLMVLLVLIVSRHR